MKNNKDILSTCLFAGSISILLVVLIVFLVPTDQLTQVFYSAELNTVLYTRFDY